MSAQPPLSPKLQSALTALRETQPSAPSPPQAALLTIISLLAEELYTLQNQVYQQAQLIEELRLLGRQPAPSQLHRGRPIPTPPPKVMHSMDHWLDNVPDYDGSFSEADRETFRTKPRVRPEDIPLTPADLDRQRPHRPRYVPTWNWQTVSLTIVIGLVILLFLIVVWNNFLLQTFR
jgi:hypothetical protein